MQLRQLEYFTAVAEYLNFRKAAEALYVSQPLLSRQIAELEQTLGQKLFIRNTRSVALTPAGELLYAETSNLLSHASLVERRVKRFVEGDSVSGHLRIGLEDGFDPRIVSAAVRSLRSKYPQLDISLKRYSFLDITNALKENSVDVGFVLLPDKKFSPSLSCKILRPEAQVLIVSSARVPPGGSRQDFIGVAERECLFLLEKNPKFINNNIAICIELNIAAEFLYVKDISEMLLYIRSGYGAAALPRSVYEVSPKDELSILEISPQSTSLCLAAVWNKSSQSALAALLLGELSAEGCRCDECGISWCRFRRPPKAD